MKKLVIAVALVLSSSMTAAAAVQRPVIVSSQNHSLVTIDDCDHFYIRTLTSLPAEAHEQEQRALDISGIETLRVRATEEGGISVRGWDRPVVRLTVCKFAVALTQIDAQRTLRDVSIGSRNGEISATGPQPDGRSAWWVHMILRVPKSASVDLSSSNGGIAVRDMHGRVTARATNGGISLASCSGRNRVATENGGISLSDVRGRVDASTQNGSISYRLHPGDAMPGIEARTQDSSLIRCKAKACGDALESQDGASRILRLGGSSPTVRLTTGRSPILIEQAR